MRGAGRALGAVLAVLLVLPSAADARRHRKESGKESGKRSHKKKDQAADPAGLSVGAGDSRASGAESTLKPRVAALVEEAKAALAARDFDGAQKKAEAAYRKQPSAEVLFVLGQVAKAAGLAVESHDLFRRYLADPSTASDSVRRAEAQRQANLSLPEAGDLYIVGDKESLVYVNDRLLGALPLLLPLRVAAGNLSVTLQSGGRTSRGKVEVPAGQAREMRFDELTGAVLVSVPPTVVLVEEQAGRLSSEAALVEALEKAASRLDIRWLRRNESLVRVSRCRRTVCWIWPSSDRPTMRWRFASFSRRRAAQGSESFSFSCGMRRLATWRCKRPCAVARLGMKVSWRW